MHVHTEPESRFPCSLIPLRIFFDLLLNLLYGTSCTHEKSDLDNRHNCLFTHTIILKIFCGKTATMNDPLVTLLVLNWNGETVLEECISSLRQLEYPIREDRVTRRVGVGHGVGGPDLPHL